MTITLLHPTFPAASLARTVIEFDPTRSGIDADQLVVPAANPDCPVFVAQVTAATPTLSLAVPLKLIDVAEVETDVDDGDVIVKAGGVVSVGLVEGGLLPEDVCRVIETVCETRVTPSVAEMVIVFAPVTRGTPLMVQAPVEVTEPDAFWLLDQVTVTGPFPPDVVPVMVTVAEVVVAGGAFTAMVNVTDGVGGGSVLPASAAAYIV